MTDDDEEDAPEEPGAPAWFAVTRATAFFVGAITLLNLVGEMRFPHFTAGAAGWWLDLQPLPRPAARGLLALTAVLMVIFSFFPRINAGLRRLAAAGTVGLLVAALWHTYRFYHHLPTPHASNEIPLPFSLHVAAMLSVVLAGLLTGWWERSNFIRDFFLGTVTLATCVAALPLAQFFCAGTTEEVAPADAVVVFAEGDEGVKNPEILAQQVHAASQLQRDGKARKVVLAARGDRVDELQKTMRRLATEDRVPAADLLVSATGVELDASVATASKTLEEQKLSKVLVTGAFYQLPRIKLCCQRAGLNVTAVPVHEKVAAEQLRPTLIREAVALWTCYVQPLLM